MPKGFKNFLLQHGESQIKAVKFCEELIQPYSSMFENMHRDINTNGPVLWWHSLEVHKSSTFDVENVYKQLVDKTKLHFKLVGFNDRTNDNVNYHSSLFQVGSIRILISRSLVNNNKYINIFVQIDNHR